MKWLVLCLVMFFTAAPAMAGEDPYIAVVDNDFFEGLNYQFYFSPKYQQFMYDQNSFGIPTCIPGATIPTANQYMRIPTIPLSGCESFFSQTPTIQVEVCHLTTDLHDAIEQFDNFTTVRNAKTPAGNAGFYEWWIQLPKKPSGEINIVIQCGVLKPNAYAVYGGNSVEVCAAETGERIGYGVCVRQEVDPGVSPVNNAALPKITAKAYPGPYADADFTTPFNLTAFKNPSAYSLSFDATTQAMSNNGNSQVLDGSSNARILLKACMDKAIIAKLPVTGQINALGQTETDLNAGDLIQVRMDIPRQNTVDIYCHALSARLQGVGEAPF